SHVRDLRARADRAGSRGAGARRGAGGKRAREPAGGSVRRDVRKPRRPDGRRAAGAGARPDSARGGAAGAAGAGVRHPGRERDPRGACGGAARPRAGYRARPTGERRVSDASAAARLDQLRALAQAEDLRPFLRRAIQLHPSDLAEVLAAVDGTARARALAELPIETASKALAELEGRVRHPEELLRAVGPDYVAELLAELPSDDAAPARHVREVMEPPAAAVRPEIDQEQVARLMARYNVAAVPVVDEGNRLLGRVTFDDVIDVVERETTEDLLKFASVSPEEDLSAPWSAAVKSRLPWLYVNLLTAFLAGAVVYVFQGTVSRVVALAVWMPIIAGMGGNAGTQALAVTVRRLALR